MPGRGAREEGAEQMLTGRWCRDRGRRLGLAGGALGVPGRRVLTERREAPSRARIPAALTAGIAAAPLTRAGSRDTAAPC